jgi:hypothetical protein
MCDEIGAVIISVNWVVKQTTGKNGAKGSDRDAVHISI